MTTIRRVVTAQTEAGKGIFATTQEVEPMQAGARLYAVWGWDEMPSLPYPSPSEFAPMSIFPAAGGARVNVAEFPPGMGVDATEHERSGEAREQLLSGQPGEVVDVDPGMHGTDTADICFVISGEVCLALDGGEEKVLRPGDVLVQMGTAHVWRNRSTSPCLVGFVVLGTERESNI